MVQFLCDIKKGGKKKDKEIISIASFFILIISFLHYLYHLKPATPSINIKMDIPFLLSRLFDAALLKPIHPLLSFYTNSHTRIIMHFFFTEYIVRSTLFMCSVSGI